MTISKKLLALALTASCFTAAHASDFEAKILIEQDADDFAYEDAILAVGCTATTQTAFVGGFVASRVCDGRTVSGVGNTGLEAAANLDEFVLLFAERGVACSTNTGTINSIPGGTINRYTCNGIAVSGAGSNATGVGQNALLLARVAADYGQSCTTSTGQVTAIPGSFIVRYSCGGGAVSGIGNITTAGAAAAVFARKFYQTGVACTISASDVSTTVIQINGATLANHRCTGGVGIISGLGSDSLDAGTNAAALAEVHTATGAACRTTFNDISAAGGPGFITSYNCGGTRIHGVGGRFIRESATNGVGFAQFFARTGLACTSTSFVSNGPFEVRATFYCSGGGLAPGSVTGIATGAGDAGGGGAAGADALAKANARWP